MPEALIDTEMDSTEAEEAFAAFAADGEDPGGPSLQEMATGEEEQKEETEAEETEAEETEAKTEEEEDQETEEPSLEDRVKQRSSQLEELISKAEEDQKEEEPEEKEDPAEEVKSIKDLADSLDFESLPEIETGDGEKVSMSELAEYYPEVIPAVKVMAAAAMQQLVKSGQILTTEAAAELQMEVQRLSFAQAVSSRHPDVREVVSSPEFETWIKKQPKGVQAMGSSNHPQDAIDVLDLYKASKNSKEKKSDAARQTKKRKDDLMGGTLRATKQTTTSEADEDDGLQAFLEEARK